MNIEPNLIFDLGMHTALDTDFYLQKGFRVVALEANPRLVKRARKTHKEAIRSGRLVIVERALWHESGLTIPFFLNAEKDDWSSAFHAWAAKGGHEVEEIAVETITLKDLFDDHGVPHYIKCDIEGADELFVQQLLKDPRRPNFVSVEAATLEILSLLIAKGYDAVQVVNQAISWSVKPPQPAREGGYADVTFNGHMSGLFGRELDPARWLPFTDATRNYLDFMSLAWRDPSLAFGWLDFHVTTRAVLEAPSA